MHLYTQSCRRERAQGVIIEGLKTTLMCIMNDFFQKTLREHDVESRDVLSEPSFLRNACMWNYKFSFDQKKNRLPPKTFNFTLCNARHQVYNIYTFGETHKSVDKSVVHYCFESRVYFLFRSTIEAHEDYVIFLFSVSLRGRAPTCCVL